MPESARTKALKGLREALLRARPDLATDPNGYVADFRDVLLPDVIPEDFTADLEKGDGRELQTKFRACHSSSALAVNCFAPFRRRLFDLSLNKTGSFQTLQFERKCPTGLRGGRSPNLDVLMSGHAGAVGVESKLTEFLARHRAAFSSAYREQIRDTRRDQSYFREMLRLIEAPDSYVRLDAAQLIKHAFGLAHTYPDRPVTLLYLYWEPSDAEAHPEFAEHRLEIERFAGRVARAIPTFAAMSYPDLWTSWRKGAPDWLSGHVDQLEARYLIRLEP